MCFGHGSPPTVRIGKPLYLRNTFNLIRQGHVFFPIFRVTSFRAEMAEVSGHFFKDLADGGRCFQTFGGTLPGTRSSSVAPLPHGARTLGFFISVNLEGFRFEATIILGE